MAEATPAFKAINGIEISSETLAQSTDSFVKVHNDELLNLLSDFEDMSIEELNDYILEYDNFFTSAVNNWAFLCQNTHVLNKVTINVDYTL